MHSNVLNKLYTLFNVLYRHAHTPSNKAAVDQTEAFTAIRCLLPALRCSPECDAPIVHHNDTQLPILCRFMQRSTCVQWEEVVSKPHATRMHKLHTERHRGERSLYTWGTCSTLQSHHLHQSTTSYNSYTLSIYPNSREFKIAVYRAQAATS